MSESEISGSPSLLNAFLSGQENGSGQLPEASGTGALVAPGRPGPANATMLTANVASSDAAVLLMVDESGLINYVDENCVHIFGFAPGDLVGKKFSFLLTAPYRRHYENLLANYTATGSTRVLSSGSNVVEGRTKQGRVFPMLFHIAEARQGTFVVALRPVRQTRGILQAMGGVVIAANDAAASMFGFANADALVGRSVADLIVSPKPAINSVNADSQPGRRSRGASTTSSAAAAAAAPLLPANASNGSANSGSVSFAEQPSAGPSEDGALFRSGAIFEPQPGEPFYIDVMDDTEDYVPQESTDQSSAATAADPADPTAQLATRPDRSEAQLARPEQLDPGFHALGVRSDGVKIPISMRVQRRRVGLVELFRADVEPLAATSEVVMILDGSGTVLSTNHTACVALFGWEPRDLVGRSIHQILSESAVPGAVPPVSSTTNALSISQQTTAVSSSPTQSGAHVQRPFSFTTSKNSLQPRPLLEFPAANASANQSPSSQTGQMMPSSSLLASAGSVSALAPASKRQTTGATSGGGGRLDDADGELADRLSRQASLACSNNELPPPSNNFALQLGLRTVIQNRSGDHVPVEMDVMRYEENADSANWPGSGAFAAADASSSSPSTRFSLRIRLAPPSGNARPSSTSGSGSPGSSTNSPTEPSRGLGGGGRGRSGSGKPSQDARAAWVDEHSEDVAATTTDGGDGPPTPLSPVTAMLSRAALASDHDANADTSAQEAAATPGIGEAQAVAADAARKAAAAVGGGASHQPVLAAEAAGHRMLGPWVLNKELGRGTFCRVWLASHFETHALAAVKLYDCANMNKDDFKRAANELNALRLVQGHPNVVKMFDVICTSAVIAIVLEYLGGGELLNRIIARNGFPEYEARSIFTQIVAAVQHCHSKGVYHRDLKHQNILLRNNGDIVIIDFGLATVKASSEEGEKTLETTKGGSLGDQGDFFSNTFCGTPAYASPNLLASQPYEPAGADVWSLGVVLYTLVAAKFPFRDVQSIFKGQFRPLPRSASPDLRNLVDGMLNVDPKERLTLDQVVNHPFLTTEIPLAQRIARSLLNTGSSEKAKEAFKVLMEYPPSQAGNKELEEILAEAQSRPEERPEEDDEHSLSGQKRKK